MHKIFKIELPTFQGKCVSLQSITVNVTPALTAGPARAAWSLTTVTARLVSTAQTFLRNIKLFGTQISRCSFTVPRVIKMILDVSHVRV